MAQSNNKPPSTTEIAQTETVVEQAAATHAELTAVLFQHARGMPLASLAAAGFLTLCLWDVQAVSKLLIWLIGMVCIELCRAVISSGFARSVHTPVAIQRWQYLFLGINALSAAGWGIAGGFIFSTDVLLYQLVMAITLTGLCATAIPFLAINYKAYISFLVIALAPALSGFLIQIVSGQGWQPFVVCLAGGLGLAWLAWHKHLELVEGVRARLAYSDIANNYDHEMTTRLRAESTLRRGERRSRKQNHLLLELAREDCIANGDLEAALKVITSKASHAIDSARISVWFCDNDFSALQCQHVYYGDEHETEPGFVINTVGQARLYRQLMRVRSFSVSDTQNDNRTKDYWEDYMKPLRITSLLGAPIRHGSELRGILCHEHIGLPRSWSREERAFISSLADFISLAITSSGRQRAQEELRQMANYDRLTNLPNRAMFHDRLNHALDKARRNEMQIALLFVDVDNFKKINDSLGHAVGDRVLRSIAKRLVRAVREADTVARLGGDEFTVILEDVEHLETILAITNRIIESSQEPLLLGDNELTLTQSIGISHFPRDGDTAEKLLQNADVAMYRAKKLGRNRYQFFTEDLNSTALARIAREAELRHAIERDQLVVFYQPQVNAVTNRIEGFESLVRWQHPLLGLLAPIEFIGLAEETGLIGAIGEWVLHESCRQAQEWRTQTGLDIHISVNLSVDQFYTRNMPQTVESALQATGLPARKLILEITESLAMENAETNLQVLSDLKALKVHLALDDFGTGNSSLSYLKHFPVDMLKIDRAFVQGLGHDVHVEAIARATIALAESLDLALVAEGVETKQQCEWLLAEGCELIQGYYYSKPLSAEDSLKWLIEQSGIKPTPSKKNRQKRAAKG